MKGWATVAVVLMCGMASSFFTRGNGFPYFYHPDEPGKVEQVITGEWNFHHPLLMVGTAELAKKVLGLPDDEQRIVIMGRWVSALFATGGVLAFALLGWAVRGPRGCVAGLLLATQHQVFELAHYFKEDTSLLFAMGVGFLALHYYWRRGSSGAAALAGAACGLCVSAKYLGAIMLAPAVFIFIASQRRRGARVGHWVLLAAGFLAVAAAINWPMFSRMEIFRHSVGREMTLVEHPDNGLTGQVAFFEYLKMFLLNTNPALWVLLIAEIAAHWRARRERDAFDWLMLVFPFAMMLVLSCSTKTNDRYFLPVTAGFYYLGALGALDVAGLFPSCARRAGWVMAGAVAAVCVWNVAVTWDYVAAFSQDDRALLLQAIRREAPPGAVIAAEDSAYLPEPGRPERLKVQPLLPQKVVRTKYAVDLGATPAILASEGIDYLVISDSDWGIFFRKAATRADLVRRRKFYEMLFAEAKPLEEWPRGTVIYLHPGLRLYSLKGLK